MAEEILRHEKDKLALSAVHPFRSEARGTERESFRLEGLFVVRRPCSQRPLNRESVVHSGYRRTEPDSFRSVERSL